MRTALLVGAFGQGNPGDEALLEAFVKNLEGWQTIATSASPASTVESHGCEAVSPNWIPDVARAASGADALVFAGGTIFKMLHPSSRRSPGDLLRKGLVLASSARVMGKPVAMLGVGAGRLEGTYAPLLARAFAQRSDLLVLRDEESARLLAQAGVRPPFRIGSDPAWSLFDPPANGARGHRGDRVVVALSHLAGDETLAAGLAAGLAPISSRGGVRFEIQPWQHSTVGDMALARSLAASLDARIISPPLSLREARDRYGSARLVVGLRFHALMAAAAAGTPFVAYGHEAKLVGLARRLGQPCYQPGASAASLAQTIVGGLETGPAHPDAVGEQVATAVDGFRLLRLLLDGPQLEGSEEVSGLRLAPAPAEP